jgi:secreted Zn-dependent insulinase-like peptidase
MKTWFSRSWQKRDTLFLTPKAFIKMDFHYTLSHISPESSVLTDLLTRYATIMHTYLSYNNHLSDQMGKKVSICNAAQTVNIIYFWMFCVHDCLLETHYFSLFLYNSLFAHLCC